MNGSRRRALLLLVILGGFALRLYQLGVNSLWYDETVSLLLARNDIAELIRHTAGDIHPPFYYLLLHFWGGIAGWSEFSVAFLSLWFGVLLMALVWRAARDWTTPSVALIAALLVAVSPYNVWYSQEVRMYTLGAVLGLASVYFLTRLVQNPRPFARDFWAYVLVTVIGFYTLYYFVFLMVFEYVYVAYTLWHSRTPRASSNVSRLPFSSPNSRRFLLTFIASQIALVILYLPWLPTAFRQAADPPVPPWRTFINLPQVLLESFSALTFGQAIDPLFVAPLLLLLAALIAFGIVFAARRLQTQRPQGAVLPGAATALFMLGYTFIPLLAIFLFSLWKPLYHVRYIFTYSPAFYILIALSLAHLQLLLSRSRLAQLVTPLFLAVYIVVSAFALNNFWNDSKYAEDDLRGAVNYIAAHWRPGDAVLVNAGYAYPALLYYWNGAQSDAPMPPRERLTLYAPGAAASSDDPPLILETGSIGGAPNLGWGDPQSDFYATTADETRAALARVFAAHPRVWMLRIYDTVVDPDGIIRQYFADNATLLDDQVFAGESNVRVQGYLTQEPGALPEGTEKVSKNLGDRVELVGYETGARERHAGDAFDAVLYWQLLQSVNFNYQLTLQLLDANGENVAQSDETPLSELLPMTRWDVGKLYREPVRLQIPATLPPGDYRAIIKLYNPRSGEVLGDEVDLGQVRVPPR